MNSVQKTIGLVSAALALGFGGGFSVGHQTAQDTVRAALLQASHDAIATASAPQPTDTPAPPAPSPTPYPVRPVRGPAQCIEKVCLHLVGTTVLQHLDDGATPPAGKVFLVTWFVAQNNTSSDLQLDIGDFTVAIPHATVDAGLFSTPGQDISATTMVAGGQLAGSRTYEVPRSGHRVQIRWQRSDAPHFMTDPVASWDITY